MTLHVSPSAVAIRTALVQNSYQFRSLTPDGKAIGDASAFNADAHTPGAPGTALAICRAIMALAVAPEEATRVETLVERHLGKGLIGVDRAGRRSYVFQVSGRVASHKLSAGVEVLGRGAWMALDGVEWRDGRSPENVPRNALPTVTKDKLAELSRALEALGEEAMSEPAGFAADAVADAADNESAPPTAPVLEPLVTSEVGTPAVDAPAIRWEFAKPQGDAASLLLSRVLDWRGEGFRNLHYFVDRRRRDGKPQMWGYGCATRDEFDQQLAYILGRNDTRGMYFCTSLQAECGVAVGPSHKAERISGNAVLHKVFVADVDAAPDAVAKKNGYPTGDAAKAAIESACAKIGLPLPNGVVASGSGGYHCYWILSEAITTARWQPVAEALLEALVKAGITFDGGCTVDAARLLRIPGTSNFKLVREKRAETPTRVELLHLADDYTLAQIEEPLRPFIGKGSARPAHYPEGNALALLPKRHARVVNELAGGITSREAIDIDLIAESCGFIKEAVETGGRDFKEPLWHLSTLLAVFADEGREQAHRMASGHADYTPEDTDALFDRKSREREQKNLGWPSCKSIQNAGCKHCATRPHFSAGKSPAHLGMVRGLGGAGDATNGMVSTPPFADCGLPDIQGGLLTEDAALREINARFAMVDREGEVYYVHRTPGGRDVALAKGAFELRLANVLVQSPDRAGGFRQLPASKWWKHHPRRTPVKYAVFKPHGVVAENEYNFWRGFGVAPAEGTDKIRQLLRHTLMVICKGDKKKFKYLLRWLAWAVQNPDKNPETAIVLKGEGEGSGKTTLSQTMHKIFGQHGLKISSPEQLLGTHVDYLEFASFVMIEEALFAGNPQVADAVRDKITGSTIRINPKFRKAYETPNIMHAILTTNHDWAVQAGKNARRWFVCEVGEDKTFDRAWFNRLYEGLADGGYGQFLNFLLQVKLGKWHPRELHRTAELAEQQIQSAGPIRHWLLMCADCGGIPRRGAGGQYSASGCVLELDKEHTTTDLCLAYCEYRRENCGARIESNVAFGKMLMNVFGAKSYNKNVARNDGKRSPGYRIPDSEGIRQAVLGSLAIS